MIFHKLPPLFSIVVGIAMFIKMFQDTIGNKIYRSSCRRASAFDVTDADKKLSLNQANILRTFSAVSPPQCAMRCTATSNCRSYNYKHATTSNCQILDIDKNTAGSRLVSAKGWRHYEPEAVAAVRFAL